jgi:hypothetical protein
VYYTVQLVSENGQSVHCTVLYICIDCCQWRQEIPWWRSRDGATANEDEEGRGQDISSHFIYVVRLGGNDHGAHLLKPWGVRVSN